MKSKLYENIVNGAWLTSSEKIEIYSPIDNAYIGATPAMSQADIDTVVRAAKDAQRGWQTVALREKADLLYKTADILEARVDTIAEVMMYEIAKPLNDAKTEIIRTAELLRYTADVGIEAQGEIIYGSSFDAKHETKRAFVDRVPLGVVLAIAPFNYPVNLAASKIGPALIGGNTVVIKPASQGAMSTLELVRAFVDAGVPAGVINSVTGKGSVIGDYLTSHPFIDFINFTGSTSVGQHIGKIAGMKPLLFELGGKDPALVLDTEQLDRTVEEIINGAFSYSGQRCTAIKRVLVLDDIADQLVEKLVARVATLTIGSPQDNNIITPLINTETVENAKKLYEDAIAKGATSNNDFSSAGTLMAPILLDHVSGDMDIAWVEPFAPILPVIRVKSIEEMITIANASEYGLQAAIFCEDFKKARNIANELEVGTVHINQKTQRGPDNFPFLGVKQSGVGVQGVKYSIQSMTRIKSLVLDLSI